MRLRTCVNALLVVAALSGGNVVAAASSIAGADAEFASIARQAPGFGGMYYDSEGRLNIFMTPASQRSPEASRAISNRVSASLARYGRAVPAAGDIVIRTGTRDYAELTMLHERALPVVGQSGVVFTDIDETRNRLTVGVLEGTSQAEIDAALRTLGVPADAVDLEISPSIVPLSGHTLENLQEPFGGGMQISFYDEQYIYLCTLGFNLLRGAAERPGKYFMTNSHCTLDQAVVTGIDFWAPLPFGIVVPYAFLGVEVEDPPYFNAPCIAGWRCRWSDAAMVRYAEESRAAVGTIYRTKSFGTGATPGSIEIDESAPAFSVVAERPWSLVGEVVNKMGRSTGWTRGAVTRNCVNVRRSSSPPTALLCQAFVSAGSYFGDSGSPVFQPIGDSHNVRLHGILWGGPGQPPFNFFVYSIMDGIREDFDGPDCRWTGPDGTVRCPADRTFRTH